MARRLCRKPRSSAARADPSRARWWCGGLSQAEAARLFGVSRQALAKWVHHGIPSDRVRAVSDLAAATDLLVHYLKRDRIPGGRAQTHPCARGCFPDGFAGAGGDTRTFARDVPRNVPIRAHAHLTVELLREPVPDAHVWWRIADSAWTNPLEPTFAQRQGGRWNPPDSFPCALPQRRRGDGTHEPSHLRRQMALRARRLA